MDDFGELFAFITAVMFFILLSKFNTRFRRMEDEFEEIKNRMDEFLRNRDRGTLVGNNEEETLRAASRETLQEVIVEEEVILSCVDIQEEETDEETAAPIVRKKKPINYEKFIGENLFGKIGILIFVIGVGFFVKYAIDQDWINETVRTVLGFFAGSALLAVAERLQKKYRTFSSILAGGAFAVFYLTVAIAFHYYHLFSQSVAFIILVATTVLMTVLSVLYDRRELAITSLVGGFLAPFIVSGGAGNYIVLFTYLSILDVGMFILSIRKKWAELPVISFVFTYLIMGIFILQSYLLSSTMLETSAPLLGFATLFYFIFMLPVLSILRADGMRISRVLLSLVVANNFFYLFLGLLFLQNILLPFKVEGLLSLFIALANLWLVVWLRKTQQHNKNIVYSILGLIVTFVSITIPIQLEGNYITLFWVSEMVLLLWLYVKTQIRVYEYATVVLTCLTLISFVMDILFMLNYGDASGIIFLNGSFATTLFMGLATGASALLMERNRAFFSTTRILSYNPWNGTLLLASVAILYGAFMMEFLQFFVGATANGSMLLFTSASIFAFCYVFRNRFPMERYSFFYILGIGLTTLIYIFNIWVDYWPNMTLCPILLRWAAVAFAIASLYYVAWSYWARFGMNDGMMVYLNVLATLIWLTMVHSFLLQVGELDFSTGFSLSLSVAGLVQLGLGMRLHLKMQRVIGLWAFAIILLKLGFIDLWALPTIGKIVVFIILGLMLLVLSFLYQKLKDVLFKEDENEKE